VNDTCQPVAREQDSLRTMAIVADVCLLLGFATGIAAIGAVIIAYIQRNEARGTIWEGHYDAVISTFWVSLVGLIVGILLCFILIGIPILAVLAVWVIYRAIRGLVHALDVKPY
jgi:Predicted membrane protein